VVQVPEPGRHAHLDAVLEFVDDLVGRLAHARVLVGPGAVADRVRFGLRPVHDRGQVAGLVGRVTHGRDAQAGLDQAAAGGQVAHDRGVPGDGRGGGDVRAEPVDLRCAAHVGEFAAAFQFGDDGEGVHLLAGVVQVQDLGVDLLVCGLVEVLGDEDFGDVGDGALVADQAAEDGGFGVEVLRGCAVGHDVLAF